MKRIPASTIAGLFALAAFAVAIMAGLASGNPAQSVLMRALLAMVLCYPVGLAVGLIAQQLVHDHVEAHRASYPADERPESIDAPTIPEADESDEPSDEEVLVA